MCKCSMLYLNKFPIIKMIREITKPYNINKQEYVKVVGLTFRIYLENCKSNQLKTYFNILSIINNIENPRMPTKSFIC
jgi:hypothetical protein